MDHRLVLLARVAFLTVYVIGVGGTTAAAIGVRESWRRRSKAAHNPDLKAPEVVLNAPTLPRRLRLLRAAGWIAFPFALGLGVFANQHYPWVLPVTVIFTDARNAFYFNATRALGARLTLPSYGFRISARALPGGLVPE